MKIRFKHDVRADTYQELIDEAQANMDMLAKQAGVEIEEVEMLNVDVRERVIEHTQLHIRSQAEWHGTATARVLSDEEPESTPEETQ